MAQQVPSSAGRISVFSRQIVAKDGRLLIGFSGDQRENDNPHQPIHDRALFGAIPKPDAAVGSPKLADYTAPEPQGIFRLGMRMRNWKQWRQHASIAFGLATGAAHCSRGFAPAYRNELGCRTGK